MSRADISALASFSTRLATMVALTMAAGVAPAAGASIGIDSFSGSWTNPVGGNVLPVIDASGDALDAINWGANTDTDVRTSGYTFLPGDAIAEITVGTPFLLGTFTHYNNEILASAAITAVDYDLSFGFTGVPPSVNLLLQFAHDETKNLHQFCASEPEAAYCADIVTMSLPIINLLLTDGDGNEYYFNLVGFSHDGGATTTSQFFSPEGLTNAAGLYGLITHEQLVAAPEPATLVLFGSGLLGAAAARRKRRQLGRRI